MIAYEPHRDTECPVCGNTKDNRDFGPYEYHPLDDMIGGTPDPRVHYMNCGKCRKGWDEMPDDLAREELVELVPYYSDACPHRDCHPGDHPASPPLHWSEKRGRILTDHQCPRGHHWVTWWGNGRHIYNHWAVERMLTDPAASADEAVEALRLLEEALGTERDVA